MSRLNMKFQAVIDVPSNPRLLAWALTVIELFSTSLADNLEKKAPRLFSDFEKVAYFEGPESIPVCTGAETHNFYQFSKDELETISILLHTEPNSSRLPDVVKLANNKGLGWNPNHWDRKEIDKALDAFEIA